MKSLILLFLFMLIAITAGNTLLEAETMKNEIKEFKIEIIRYYFGRENIRIVVTNEQLMCETALSLNRKDYILDKRVLTDEESAGMKEFLTGFPLKEFKESYYNKGVKDGMQIRFIINLDGIEKNIYIANYYIKELGGLASVITNLLSEDHLNYNPKTVQNQIRK